ncbi:MAG: ABC transporter permease [Cyanobacteria bacterium P01_H01_bin.21]
MNGMQASFFLAWKYLSFNKLRTTILIACVTLVGALPLSLNLLLSASERELMARAETTPLVVGAKGSDLDLAINSLYFTTVPPEPITMAEVNQIQTSSLAIAIPLHTQFQARNFPIIGTTLDYLDLRQLSVADGRNFSILGETVLGADVAAALSLKPGDTLVSSPESVFDFGGVYPLKMNVVGVLEKSYTADDNAVFVDIKTAWVIQGLGHGHQDLAQPEDADVVLEQNDNVVTANANLTQYNQIDADNLASFHFHGSTDTFPLTAIIAVPQDDKSAAILRGRYEVDEASSQIIQPASVIEELLLEIFKVRNILNLVFVLVTVATVIALILVFNLSLRLRQREMETNFKLGCCRSMIIRLVTAEIATILVVSLGCSLVITAGTGVFKDRITRTMLS